MKICPIKSFNNITYKKNDLNQKSVSKPSFCGEDSLEILGNYNAPILNDAYPKKDEGRKERVRSVLSREKRFLSSDVDSIVSKLSFYDEISKIQEEIVFDLYKNRKISGANLSEIIFHIKNNEKIADIQKELIMAFSSDKKFSGDDVVSSLYGISSDYETARAQRDIALELSQMGKYNGSEISEIIYSMSMKRKPEILQIQKDIIFSLYRTGRFSASDISKINSQIAPYSLELAEIQRNFVNKFSKNNNFNGNNILNVVESIRFYDGVFSPWQADFLNGLEKRNFLHYNNLLGSIGSFMLDCHSSRKSSEQLNFIENVRSTGLLQDTSILNKDQKSLFMLYKYIEKHPEFNNKEFLEYLSSIDFDKLGEISKNISGFSFRDCLKFGAYHFINGEKTEFRKEDLILREDLSDFLSYNYMNADSLSDLFSIFPETKREVGEIPTGWLDRVPSSKRAEAEEKIFGAIDKFIKDRDEESLSKSLSKILRKEVKIEFLDHGTYGTGYRLSMEGFRDTCLKIFDRLVMKPQNPKYNQHGEHAEVQIGLFANRYVKNFVKMYFGRVSPGVKRDGFMVTQFLDNNVELDDSVGKEEGRYEMNSYDARGMHNIIKGIIFDYGDTYIRDNKTGGILDSYDFMGAENES